MKRSFELSCSDINYELVKECAKSHGISMGELLGEFIDCLAGEGNGSDERNLAHEWYLIELVNYR